MRHRLIALCIAALASAALPASAQVGVSVNIGINVPAYPQMVLVPGYPVYYAPGLHANFFFFDGMYWVFQGDNWYMSAWYNGPWELVAPAYVPYYVLRVPVRYYRVPPPYFRGWRPTAPPHWGERWGPQWEQQHRDWNQRDRRAVPPPAPLPSYQRRYPGQRYPGAEQQPDLQARNYRYQPRSDVAREHYQRQQAERKPAAAAKEPPGERGRGHGKEAPPGRRDEQGRGPGQ
jgi:hypothetical protein